MVTVLLIAGDQLPVYPSIEGVGSVNTSPTQIGATWLNVGVTGSPTTTVIVEVVAHCPAPGVNVYSVVTVLLMAGDQVPVIPSREGVGSVNASPIQIGVTWLNVGVTGSFTTTVIVVLVAHCPPSGVNVYSVVTVLFMAGNQVPVTPSREVDSNENVSPAQIGAIWLNVGLVEAFTTTSIGTRETLTHNGSESLTVSI